MKTLTVFTPAYNRAHTLRRTYESLLRQTCDDFEWLVIDDGSTDNTRELVAEWISDNKLPIRYIYQENQGMHGAHNTAYANIDTELNVCIDSDDWMPDDAVESIINFWCNNKSEDVAGFIGLDQASGGGIIGDRFSVNKTTLWEYNRTGGSGDKKLVYRTDIIKKYPPYPVFEGEKYVSLASKYFIIGLDYEMLTFNKVLVIVDYQTDGSSYNMYRNYVNNPRGFVYDRKLVLSTHPDIRTRLKYCIHYVANKILAGEVNSIVSDSPCKLTTMLALPLGYIWYRFILHQYKKGAKIKLKI